MARRYMGTKLPIGTLIRKKRVEKSWTQEKLSTVSGINSRSVQKIEAGDRIPSLATIFKLAVALGITPDTIITPVWKEWKKSNK